MKTAAHRDIHSFPTRRSSDLLFHLLGQRCKGSYGYNTSNRGFILNTPLNCEGFNAGRSEEHTSELQSQSKLVCRLQPEKKKRRADLDLASVESDACLRGAGTV